MKAAVIRFPGSNCDQDCFHALHDVFGVETHYVWHKDTSLDAFDLIVLPGGFSYGDYLRCGAIARFSPVMKSLVEQADKRQADPRHLQRLSDFLRSAPAARRSRPQPLAALHLRAHQFAG